MFSCSHKTEERWNVVALRAFKMSTQGPNLQALPVAWAGHLTRSGVYGKENQLQVKFYSSSYAFITPLFKRTFLIVEDVNHVRCQSDI